MIPRRFAVTAILVFGIFTAPLDGAAQSAGRVPRIGLIGDQSPDEPRIAGFHQGLRDLGYVEGRNILIEHRFAHGKADRFPELVSELIRLKVDVLVVGGGQAALEAKAQTKTVPIVFANAPDPTGTGLVTSLARPGGNMTGLSILLPELTGKQLELLKAVVPGLSRVGVLHNPENPSAKRPVSEAIDASKALGLELKVVEVRQPSELPGAFAALVAWRAGGVLAVSDPMLGSELAQISRLAAANRLPAIYNRREFAVAGGLLTYGPNFTDNHRRAAGYVDRILKGAKPAELPVEQPTQFDRVINRRTAKSLDLTIPASVLGAASEVID